jgi:MFS superfamily sulfate permease-like transporter
LKNRPATILILVGYKLAKPATFKHFFGKGKYQFITFVATLVAVVTTDLLKGVALGIVISIIFILKGNLKRAYSFKRGVC